MRRWRDRGKREEQLAPSADRRWILFPSYRGDGRWILFLSYRGERSGFLTASSLPRAPPCRGWPNFTFASPVLPLTDLRLPQPGVNQKPGARLHICKSRSAIDGLGVRDYPVNRAGSPNFTFASPVLPLTDLELAHR